MKTYVEKGENGYRIIGKRISLESIIYLFNNGSSPESISKSFPLLDLEEVYGAIAFYLADRKSIDLDLEKEEKNACEFVSESRKKHSDWHLKMKAAEKNLVSA